MIHIKVHKQHVKESEVSISLMIQTKVHKQHVYNYYTIRVYRDDVPCMSRNGLDAVNTISPLMYMLLTQIVRYSWKRDGFRIIRPDRLIPGASDVASSGGGSPVVGTGGVTGCSSVLSSRNVTRRRVCSVPSLRMFSASSSLRCDLVLRNLVPFGV